jgi:drug/metabolite transporter (DMT)-like permease
MPENAAVIAQTRARAEKLALIALFAGAAGIAFGPIFVRLSEVGPVATAFWRTALAVPVLALWLALEQRGRRRRSPSPRQRLMLCLTGVFFACDLSLWHWSIKLTSVANSTLLANLAPIFVTLGAWLLYGQRVRTAFVLGMAVALAGAVVLMGQSLSIGTSHILGDGLGVITAMFYGAYIIAVSRLAVGLSTATIVTWSAAATSLALLPVVVASGESLWPQTAYGWSMLLGLAILSHAGGQSLIAYALAHLPASFSSVGLLAQPVGAAVLAWLILAEPLGWLQALGGAIVLAGIVLARRASRT